MNDLCVEIQNEKNYQKFEELTREVTALISAKQSRFPESKFAPVGTGQKVLQATAVRTMKSLNVDNAEVIEIHIETAEPLYSEIRVENSFTDEHGNALALQPPARLHVKFQAPADQFAERTPDEITS